MQEGQLEQRNENIFSKRIKAGKNRAYFFDVKETKAGDNFIIITESRKRYDSEHYERHKIFLYKEDFNKFSKALDETVGYVKTELMPNFDFDAFNYDDQQTQNSTQSLDTVVAEQAEPEAINKVEQVTSSDPTFLEDVDKW